MFFFSFSHSRFFILFVSLRFTDSYFTLYSSSPQILTAPHFIPLFARSYFTLPHFPNFTCDSWFPFSLDLFYINQHQFLISPFPPTPFYPSHPLFRLSVSHHFLFQFTLHNFPFQFTQHHFPFRLTCHHFSFQITRHHISFFNLLNISLFSLPITISLLNLLATIFLFNLLITNSLFNLLITISHFNILNIIPLNNLLIAIFHFNLLISCCLPNFPFLTLGLTSPIPAFPNISIPVNYNPCPSYLHLSSSPLPHPPYSTHSPSYPASPLTLRPPGGAGRHSTSQLT